MFQVLHNILIQGKLSNSKAVLIDYGTGYFVERPIDKATQFCDRKLKLLNES